MIFFEIREKLNFPGHDEKIENIIRELAFDRLTKMSDITNVIDFLKSKKSDYITGQVIYLGGG